MRWLPFFLFIACDNLRPVQVRFEAHVGDQPFKCGITYPFGKPQDFRFYVHDVRFLIGAEANRLNLESDGVFQNDTTAVLDFVDDQCTGAEAAVHTVLIGTTHGSGFNGLSFLIGLPDDSLEGVDPPLGALFYEYGEAYPVFEAHIEGGASVQIASTDVAHQVKVVLTDFDPTSGVVAIDFAALFTGSVIDAFTAVR